MKYSGRPFYSTRDISIGVRKKLKNHSEQQENNIIMAEIEHKETSISAIINGFARSDFGITPGRQSMDKQLSLSVLRLSFLLHPTRRSGAPFSVTKIKERLLCEYSEESNFEHFYVLP